MLRKTTTNVSKSSSMAEIWTASSKRSWIFMEVPEYSISSHLKLSLLSSDSEPGMILTSRAGNST